LTKSLKYFKVLGLVSVLIGAVVLAGCMGGTQSTTTQTSGTQTAKWPDQLLFRAGSAGSAWSVLATTLAGMIEQNTGVSFRVEPGGSFGNTIAVGRGEVDLAFTQSAWMSIFADPEKLAKFTDEKIDGKKIKIIANDILGEFVLLIYAHPDFEADTLEEIIDMIKQGKPVRIGVGGGTGSLEAFLPEIILEYYGLSLEDLKKAGGSLSITGASTAVSQVIEGKLDVVIDIGTLGSAAYKELEIKMPEVKMIVVPKDLRDYFTQEVFSGGGLEETIIRKGTYAFIREDYPTLRAKTVLICRADLPEDLVYEIVKTMVEKQEDIKATLPMFQIDPNKVAKSVGGIELHPGAEKYYKEKGYLK